MKEFWIYTGLRIALFVASLGVVAGVWMLVSDEVPLLWVVVIAFALSGVASYVLLNRQREAFARRVEARAERASAAFEAARAKEDRD
jgi:ABC-type bacteriocin/lantibiotic exporter with double-glycine peptidase domain